MKQWERVLYSLHPFLLSSIAGALTIVQVVSAVLVRRAGRAAPSDVAWILGWLALWLAGVFGLLPVVALGMRGGVPEGKSYTETTVLVESGIYGIVRHPQGGVAWLLINLGLMLIALHWVVAILGCASMVLVYLDALKADRYLVKKFGDGYTRYMQKVPRVNFLAGIIRALGSRKS